MLMHHADSMAGRLERRAQLQRLALEHYPACVGPQNSAKNAHEHALAGAVLADQGEDFALANLDRRGGVRRDPAEPLADVLHLQDRRARDRHPYAFQ